MTTQNLVPIALVSNGIVINTIMASSNYVSSDATITAVPYQIGQAAKGWSYNGSAFTPPAPAVPTLTPAQLLEYASATQNKVLAQMWTFNVGTTATPINLTTKLDANGQAAMMKLALWGMMFGSASVTEPYSNCDYSSAEITPAQASSLAQQAGSIVSQSYAALNAIAACVIASPPTITGTSQIDAYAWPTPAPASTSSTTT